MIEKTEHTQGSWEYVPDEYGNFVIAGHTMTGLGGECNETEEAEANARLIAAAPDLLAVVEELEESSGYWSEYDVPLGIVDRIKAVLAKARGKS